MCSKDTQVPVNNILLNSQPGTMLLLVWYFIITLGFNPKCLNRSYSGFQIYPELIQMHGYLNGLIPEIPNKQYIYGKYYLIIVLLQTELKQ